MAYGVDTWCGDSLVTGRLSRGKQTAVLALYRRLRTPRGTLRGGEQEQNYGIDLSEYVGQVGVDTALASLPGVVAGELEKDARVAPPVIVRTAREDRPDGTAAVLVSVSATLVDEDEPVAFSVSVDEVTVALVGGVG